jgi:hypothetical protein
MFSLTRPKSLCYATSHTIATKKAFPFGDGKA